MLCLDRECLVEENSICYRSQYVPIFTILCIGCKVTMHRIVDTGHMTVPTNNSMNLFMIDAAFFPCSKSVVGIPLKLLIEGWAIDNFMIWRFLLLCMAKCTYAMEDCKSLKKCCNVCVYHCHSFCSLFLCNLIGLSKICLNFLMSALCSTEWCELVSVTLMNTK